MNPTRRNTQEDVHVVHGPGSWGAPIANATFLGVMDGHGGRRIVDYLEEHLAKNVANEWTFAAGDGSDEDNDSNNNDGGGGGGGSRSVDRVRQPPKKRRLGDDDSSGNSNNKENNNGTALLDTESQVIQTALERAFLITDIQSRIDGIITSGATVACCIVVPNYSTQTGNITSITIHAANAGDARAVLSSGTARRRRRRRHSLPMVVTSQGSSVNNNINHHTKTNNNKSKLLLPNPELANELPLHRGTNAIRITHDHKSTDPIEIARIQSSGGIIVRGRVLGVLAVARSLGDHGFKEFVIAKPYLSSTTVRMIERSTLDDSNGRDNDIEDKTIMSSSSSSSHQAPFTDDEFLVVACDGLWDVMEDQEVVDFIRKHIHVHENDHDHHANQCRENVASYVIEEALKRGSTDNITVIVYWL